MKEFLKNFAIDTIINLIVSLYNKNGQEPIQKLFKDISLKLDIVLDNNIQNKNSTQVRMTLSEIVFQLSQEIRNPALRRDNSEK